MWARLRHDRNGELLREFMLGDRPMIRVRIPRPGALGGSEVVKNLPYEDVLFLSQYPSRFERLIGRKRVKNFVVKIKK